MSSPSYDFDDDPEAVQDDNEEEQEQLNDAVNDTLGSDVVTAHIPYILRSYFRIDGEISGGKANGKCTLCIKAKKPKPYSCIGDLRVVSNLKRHLKTSHPNAHTEYEEAMRQAKQKVGPAYTEPQSQSHSQSGDANTSSSSVSSVSRKRKYHAFGYSTLRATKQEQFEENLVDFVTSGLLPFSIVDQPKFKKLFEFDPEIKVMSRRKLMRHVQKNTEEVLQEVTKEVAGVEYVCTMADVWSSKHHAYMGASVHWLDDKLQRRSRVLACKHFEGSHTGEATAEEIIGIHAGHGISVDKIVAAITDSASTMIKAFRICGIHLRPENNDRQQLVELELEEGEESLVDDDVDGFDDDEEMDQPDDNELQRLENEVDAFEAADLELSQGYLPKHRRFVQREISDARME